MLIFSIVIAGIALVTLYGYPMLLQQQTSADEKIMEKNMIVLQNDIKSLAYKTVPYKETSLKIGGGPLTVYNSSTSSSEIKIYDPFTTYVDSFKPGELRYESISSQTDISIQNGAVMLRPRVQKGSTMLAEPRWFYDQPTNTMVINLINITSTHIIAKEGIGTVQMVLVGDPSYNETIFNAGNPAVKLDYIYDSTQDYSVGWNNYFTETLNMPLISTSGTTNTYRLPIDMTRQGKLVIKKFEVEIRSI
jgi:hypothetical protein